MFLYGKIHWKQFLRRCLVYKKIFRGYYLEEKSLKDKKKKSKIGQRKKLSWSRVDVECQPIPWVALKLTLKAVSHWSNGSRTFAPSTPAQWSQGVKCFLEWGNSLLSRETQGGHCALNPQSGPPRNWEKQVPPPSQQLRSRCLHPIGCIGGCIQYNFNK